MDCFVNVPSCFKKCPSSLYHLLGDLASELTQGTDQSAQSIKNSGVDHVRIPALSVLTVLKISKPDKVF